MKRSVCMTKPQQRWQAFYQLTISLLVVVVPFLTYFYFYFQSRHDYFVSRNFRTLTDVGTQLTSLLEQFGPLFALSPVDVDTRTLELQEKQRGIQLDRTWLTTLSNLGQDGKGLLDEYWNAYRESEKAKDEYNAAKGRFDATLRIIREGRRQNRRADPQQKQDWETKEKE